MTYKEFFPTVLFGHTQTDGHTDIQILRHKHKHTHNILIHRHKETQTYIQKDTQTWRQTYGQTAAHIDRQIH